MKKRLLLSAVVASIALPPMTVHAQLEEIIVTARKRDESALKIPVVASVLTGEQIDRFSINDLQGVSERVPGLQMGSATMAFGSQVSLRGVGTSVLNATLDQSVSLNVDGMQMTQGLAYKAGMFDMEQVEVLKGPQALFYGKASPGGVISIRTAGPGEHREVITRYGYETEAREHRAEFIASGPVNDTLGLRLAASYSDLDGYFENKAQALPGTGARDPRHRRFAPKEEWLVRGTARWTPTDRFEAQLKLNVMHSRVEGDGGGMQMAACPDGLVPPPPGIPFVGGGEDCRIDGTIRIVDLDPAAFPGIRNRGTPFSEMDQMFGTLELNYEVTPELTLTSVTGFYDVKQDSMTNGTNTTYAGPALAADPGFRRDDFTQELRLTSNFTESPVDFMLGAFYQDGSMRYVNNLLGNTAYGLPAQLERGVQDIDIDTQSVFGQLIWSLTPQVELAGGVRWTREVRKHSVTSTITGAPITVPTAKPRLSSSDLSPEISLTYMPTDDLTLFAALKQAYKSGSFDTTTLPVPGSDVSFGDEHVKGGEAGLKAQFMDRRLLVNLAGYYYEYDDMQVGANDATSAGLVIIRTLNAASAEVYGIDLDATYLPEAIDGLTLYGAVNYNRARYKDFDNAQCWGGQTIAEGCNRVFDDSTGLFSGQDLSGKPLVRAPEWTGNIGADYETALTEDLILALGVNATYSSKYATDLVLRSDQWQSSYWKTNASLALRNAADTWELALIGNNLNDKIVTGNCLNANLTGGIIFGGMITGGAERGPAGIGEVQCYAERGRSLWLRFTLKFS